MNPLIKSTESGKLYIDRKDFFNQPEIIEQIKKMMNSDFYKRIKAKKP